MHIKEIEQVFDTVYPEQINLRSFERKEKLCPAIWRNGDMKKAVRSRLIRIADDFVDGFEEFKLVPEDIVVVGSIAGYNWSKYSDIDLHVIVDLSKYAKYGKPEILKALFQRIKAAWNDKHAIDIYGYEVEIYVQDVTEENASDGVYSVLYGKWNKLPRMKNASLDRNIIKTHAAQYINMIDKLEELADRKLNGPQYEMLEKVARRLDDEIMQGRRESLAEEGENAAGNIVFKVLRRTEHIGKLKKTITKLFDKICSLSY